MAGNIVGIHVFGPDAGPEPLSNLDNNFTPIVSAVNSLNSFSNYYADSGAVNAMVATAAAGQTATAVAGLFINLLVAVTNTSTAPTLNFNGLGAATVGDINGFALLPGQLQAGVIYTFMFNGTKWCCQNLNNFGVGYPPFLRAIKSANTGRSNTTVLTNDPDLVIAVPFVGKWLFTAQLYVSQSNVGAVGFASNINYSAAFNSSSWVGDIGNIPPSGLWTAPTTAPAVSSLVANAIAPMGTANQLSVTAAAPDALYISGVLIATAVGNLAIAWAQASSNAVVTTLAIGSYLTIQSIS